jgi:hypothetical protein
VCTRLLDGLEQQPFVAASLKEAPLPLPPPPPLVNITHRRETYILRPPPSNLNQQQLHSNSHTADEQRRAAWNF